MQFSVGWDGDQEKFDRLFAMRDLMHRVLNTAIVEYARADKVVSSTFDPDRLVAGLTQKLPRLSKPKVDALTALVGSLDPQDVVRWVEPRVAAIKAYVAAGRPRKDKQNYVQAVAQLDRFSRDAQVSVLTDERGLVTDAVLGVMQAQRTYWTERVDERLAAVQRLQVDLGRARRKADPKALAEIEKKLVEAQREVQRARIRSTLTVPTEVYDRAVQFAGQRFNVYRKSSYAGDRVLDTFRAGQPVRWRTDGWSIVRCPGGKHPTCALGYTPRQQVDESDLDADAAHAPAAQEHKPHYELTLPVDGSTKATFSIWPDGPGMHGYARQMVDADMLASGEVKCAEAALIYVPEKKRWFAKLTIVRNRPPPKTAGTQVAVLRRGVNSAFVIAFEKAGGPREPLVMTIDGGDVLAFKRQIKARKVSVQKHNGKLDQGKGSMGRGRKGRFRALRKIGQSEDNFVNSRCQKWAAAIAAECATRGVGTLHVAQMTGKDMTDGKTDNVVQALLYQWPFAKMLDKLKQACEQIPVDAQGRGLRGKIRRTPTAYRRVVVEEFDASYDARTCPRCDHRHDKRPVHFIENRGVRTIDTAQGPQTVTDVAHLIGVFRCEICAFERPADELVALNGLKALVGHGPIEKLEADTVKVGAAIKQAIQPTG